MRAWVYCDDFSVKLDTRCCVRSALDRNKTCCLRRHSFLTAENALFPVDRCVQRSPIRSRSIQKVSLHLYPALPPPALPLYIIILKEYSELRALSEKAKGKPSSALTAVTGYVKHTTNSGRARPVLAALHSQNTLFGVHVVGLQHISAQYT